ncbi:MAG: hypothetical protein KatS3mg061_0545 [Dehalococcoidia bacterium]|nr:MAG: hypothetical protein KatS3mg061_0545 [Dehalococcoidia bacterium]
MLYPTRCGCCHVGKHQPLAHPLLFLLHIAMPWERQIVQRLTP